MVSFIKRHFEEDEEVLGEQNCFIHGFEIEGRSGFRV